MKKQQKNIAGSSFIANWYERKGPDSRVGAQRAQELKDMGFYAGADLVYDFEKYGYDAYANDRDFFYMHPLNGWFTKLIDDKRFIPILFRNLHHYIPDLSIAIEKRHIRYILESGNVVQHENDLESLVEKYLGKYNALFVKPAGLSGGRGAFRITQNTPMDVLENIHPDHAYLISNFLQNEAYSQNINPHNANTLRAYFYRHKKVGLKFFRIFHRFGTKMSQDVDNISSGGMACEINIETGKMSKATAIMQTLTHHDYHPDTKHRLADFIIPKWDNKLHQLNEILSNLFYLDFGALDVAPTPEGLKVLEINSLPSRRLIQYNTPAFLDSDFKEFCTAKGYQGTYIGL